MAEGKEEIPGRSSALSELPEARPVCEGDRGRSQGSASWGSEAVLGRVELAGTLQEMPRREDGQIRQSPRISLLIRGCIFPRANEHAREQTGRGVGNLCEVSAPRPACSHLHEKSISFGVYGPGGGNMAKDGTRRGGARAGAGRKRKALADRIAEGQQATVIDLPEHHLLPDRCPERCLCAVFYRSELSGTGLHRAGSCIQRDL